MRTFVKNYICQPIFGHRQKHFIKSRTVPPGRGHHSAIQLSQTIVSTLEKAVILPEIFQVLAYNKTERKSGMWQVALRECQSNHTVKQNHWNNVPSSSVDKYVLYRIVNVQSYNTKFLEGVSTANVPSYLKRKAIIINKNTAPILRYCNRNYSDTPVIATFHWQHRQIGTRWQHVTGRARPHNLFTVEVLDEEMANR